MTDKIVLDNLNQDSVSLLRITITTVNDKEIEVSRWRRAYINSTKGRVQVQEEVVDPYKAAIMAVWGDVPTVVEEEVI